MKAALYIHPDKIKISEIDKPSVKDKGAIIKISGCGLCGSDIVKIKHKLAPSGSVLGHEIVGEIVEIKSNSGLKTGDRVVAGHHVPCFKCKYCLNQNYSMCPAFKETNIQPGGFCEYLFVSEDHLNNTVFKVDDSVTDIQASFTEPVACCLRAIKRSAVKKNDNVLVIGLGSIGLLLGQLSKHFGAKVSGCDLLKDRLELAENLGFDNAFNSIGTALTSAYYKSTTDEIGADVIFMASCSENSLPLALSCIRDGGTIVVFSSIASDETGFANNQIYYRELTVMGSYSPAPADLSESLDLIKKGIIKVDFASEYNFDNIEKAIKDSLENKIIKAFIKI
jgi:L-iditol 2-dehydrogenase